IPAELSWKIENITTYSEDEAKNSLAQAVSYVSRLFKIEPASFAKPDSIALSLLTSNPVRYKKNANADQKKISAYTIYAHTIALIVLDCTRDIARKPVPSALEVRH